MSITTEATQFYLSNPDAQAADQALLQRLLARSATDLTFRQQLLTSPREALSEFSGRQMPESLDVLFVENTADVTFVLPPAIDPAAELSESELEAVAGGSLIEAAIIGFTIGALAYLVGHG